MQTITDVINIVSSNKAQGTMGVLSFISCLTFCLSHTEYNIADYIGKSAKLAKVLDVFSGDSNLGKVALLFIGILTAISLYSQYSQICEYNKKQTKTPEDKTSAKWRVALLVSQTLCLSFLVVGAGIRICEKSK